MNTIRNTLKRDYSQIPNELITDTSISNGALRVLLYLFTKPDDWNVYNKDICKQLNINEKTLTKYWKELLSSRWLRRDKIPPNESGSGGYIYQIGHFSHLGQNVISPKSSEKEKSGDYSNNKPIKKELTNSNNNDDALKIANYLLEKILSIKPNFKKPNLNIWAKDIDLAMRIDKRTFQELKSCIDWIYTDKGSFWIPNIMSGKKLREKFDTMESQMMKNRNIVDNIYSSGLSANELIEEAIKRGEI